MGNTNLPQAGAADTDNGRDTLSGKDQLTEQQRQEVRHDARNPDASRSRPPEAAECTPGLRRVPAAPEDGEHSVRDDGAQRRDGGDPAEPSRNGARGGDRTAFTGHADTGHSPSGAT